MDIHAHLYNFKLNKTNQQLFSALESRVWQFIYSFNIPFDFPIMIELQMLAVLFQLIIPLFFPPILQFLLDIKLSVSDVSVASSDHSHVTHNTYI